MSHYQGILAIGRATAALVIVRIGGMGSSMLMTLMLARSLDPAEYGAVALAQSAALVAGLGCSLNAGAAAIRFVPSIVQQPGGESRLGRYLRAVHTAVLGVGAVFWIILGLVASALVWTRGVDAVSAAVLVALVAAPVLGLMRMEGAITHALGAVMRSTVPTTFVRPVVLLALVSLYPLTPLPALTPVGFGALFVASAVVAGAVQLVLYRRCAAAYTTGTFEAVSIDERRAWFGAGWALLIPVIFLEISIDVIVLLGSTVLGAEDLAALGVVLRIQGILLFGVTSINIATSPKLAHAHTLGETSVRDALIRSSGYLKLWPSLVALAALVVLGRPMLGLFGDHYEQYLDTLLLFSLMPVILAVFGPSVLFVTILGLERQARWVFVLALTGMAVAVPGLGVLFGIDGVAVAVLAIWWAWNQALHTLILRSAGFSTASVRPFRPSL